jgi:hypothetical protein
MDGICRCAWSPTFVDISEERKMGTMMDLVVLATKAQSELQPHTPDLTQDAKVRDAPKRGTCRCVRRLQVTVVRVAVL